MRGTLENVEGVPMADAIVKNWQQIKTFEARPGDILISTYPKSGTTWIQEIVDLIMNNGDEEICRRAPIYERIPFIELMHLMKPGLEEINAMPSPRVLKTHLPVQLIPASFWEHNCKVIYVARNAKDTVTSFYHFDHMVKIHPEPGTFPQYLERFMNGNVGWGSWYDHVKGFWEWKDKRDILYLLYEDLKRNSLEEIRKVMRFLDKDLSEEVLKKIVHLSSFAQMRKNPMANNSTFPKEIMDQTDMSFMRKGTVGDWKNLFTAEQSKRFEEHYKQQMKNTTLIFPSAI
ncbi:sulfotransferase 1C2-like [Spea bombifrons]|uniref:sulfotransferase 1C2-like n=1 Tax=Spea bombifrons TaxID=233779 RepID=UPI00234B1DBD|nr:sulfotransferase 1C2-like [Spea bombifrons]